MFETWTCSGARAVACSLDGDKLRSERDAIEVIQSALPHGADVILIPVERFDDDFFRLKTRVAGEFIQKFVTYRLRLAIMGDISRHLEESSALRDFVYECNAGNHVWFVANPEELGKQLEYRRL
jgi:uncharacterized protein DUF4180